VVYPPADYLSLRHDFYELKSNLVYAPEAR
jgi:hypothetical protein